MENISKFIGNKKIIQLDTKWHLILASESGEITKIDKVDNYFIDIYNYAKYENLDNYTYRKASAKGYNLDEKEVLKNLLADGFIKTKNGKIWL